MQSLLFLIPGAACVSRSRRWHEQRRGGG